MPEEPEMASIIITLEDDAHEQRLRKWEYEQQREYGRAIRGLHDIEDTDEDDRSDLREDSK